MIWIALTVGDDTNTITAPAGWTTVTLPAVTSNGQYITVFYKLAGASESNSYQFTLTDDGSFGTRFFGTVLDGVDQSSPVTATGGRKFSGLTSAVMSTVSQSDTTAVDFSPGEGDMLLAFWASGSGTRTTAGNPTFSNSFGDKHEWDSAGGNQLWVRAHRVYASAATGQNCTASWSGSGAGTSTVILHVAAASSGIEGTAALDVSVSADASGNIGVSGDSGLTVALAADGSGVLGASGAADNQINAGATASGILGSQGASSNQIGVSVDATGEVEGAAVTIEGSGAVGIAAGADASGAVGVSGAVALSLPVSVDAAGIVSTDGTATAGIGVGTSGAGALGVIGTGTADIGLTASGVGQFVTGDDPDPARIFSVEAEARAWFVAREGLSFVVPTEARAYFVPAESRAFVVASESRSYEVIQ